MSNLRSKNLRKANFYGHAIPYLEKIEIKGKFIVIGGPDASGRSTQIDVIHNLTVKSNSLIIIIRASIIHRILKHQ
jgi:ABC-type sugar transport system ATPase subunit